MSSNPNSPRAIALRYISHARFHRHYTHPATADHDSLTVTYADAGSTPSPATPSPPTILFMPGMFASRYLGVFIHAIAEKLGVRVLIVDRPGMGNSSDVPLDKRLSIWVELVPRFLAHLGIDHVALVSHSAGTLYLLNTLFHCRELLHPERPFVALLAPWVDPSHSHVTSLKMAQYVPVNAFSVWNLIPKFFLLKAGPAFTSSGVAITKTSNVISSGSIFSSDGGNDTELERNRRQIEAEYGLSRDVQAELDSLMLQFMFEESTVGANSEALQCLRKGADSGKMWGACNDYGAYVKELADLERRRHRHTGEEKLKVRAYFAGNDSMIGKTGQEYMEECWTCNTENFKDAFDFETSTFAELNHDSVVQSAEVLKSIFLQAGGGLSNESQ
ncbi:Alpha/Beta hydrolase protein [Aspergillus bertholletiae]|uniref:Alpha/Beta hydrolase protein n=1 Tax=Aspergillus bertholletiae TaxID=1226010 RepID=A0A5N7BHJ9_9EURO|nr:Alpha/Beta hydrolase protein [Aspergillus bertholletiae]